MSENSASTIADLAVKATGEPVTETVAGREFIVHPPSWVAKEVLPLTQDVAPPIPKWTSQVVRLQNEASLVDYVNRFKNRDTALFADIASDTVVAIIDYHHEAVLPPLPDGASSKVGFVQPELKAHRAILNLPKSIEWQTWMEHDEEKMSQLEFVSFLEDNAVDVHEPDGAGLLELIRDLEGTRNVRWGSTVRAGSVDNMEFTKESGAQTKGKVALPLQIVLLIPVYFGDVRVPITAMLRRHIGTEGQLTLWYKLIRPENIRQERFQTIVDNIQISTDHLTTIYGTAD